MTRRSSVCHDALMCVAAGTFAAMVTFAGDVHAQSAARVGSFVKSAGPAPTVQSVPHNLGQRPSALILWTEGRTDEAFSNAAGITFRAAASANAASGVLSLTLTRPASTLVDDLLVVGIAVSANNPTITAPTGWTLVRRTANTNTTANALAIYQRLVTAGEPGTYTWTFSASTGAAGALLAFAGVDALAPIGRARRLAQAQTRAPPTIIGTHSHWPMLKPVAAGRSCRKASGSRKYSTMKRKQP